MVTFRVDYTVPTIGREFGSVFLGEKNVALLVVSEGWAKVTTVPFGCKHFSLWRMVVLHVWAFAESGLCRFGSRVNRKEKLVLS